MVIYLSYIYLFLGLTLLLIPLIYIELGRPRDFIKAGLNLIVGLLLFIEKSVLDNLYSSILIFVTILFVFYLVEIFSIRWNQLTNQEKNKLKTFVELKKNISILLEAISIARKDLVNSNGIFKFGRNNENLDKKKWVRNGENDKIMTSNKKNSLTLEMKKTTTNQSKEDTIKSHL